jgi:hypothetical protein
MSTNSSRPMVRVNTEGVSGWTLKSNLVDNTRIILCMSDILKLILY